MDAFDADIVIFASLGDPRGGRLQEAVASSRDSVAGIGSVLLLPETLSIPDSRETERQSVLELLGRLELVSVTQYVALLAAELRSAYRLKTPDSIHLATAISAGADRFVTNNRRDFPQAIAEIDIAYPS